MRQSARAAMADPVDVTQLLQAWNRGDESARDALIEAVYGELRKLARHHMRLERQGHTLQTSALINEAYLRLADQRAMEWRNRAQFFGVAAEMMRRILVDHARGKQVEKRGAGAIHVALDEALQLADERGEEVIAVDRALNRLAELDERQSRIVEMRYFGGMTVDEIAAVLSISPATVKREWTTAKAWLARELEDRR